MVDFLIPAVTVHVLQRVSDKILSGSGRRHNSGFSRFLPRVAPDEVLGHGVDQAGRNPIAGERIPDPGPRGVLPRREWIVDRRPLPAKRKISVDHAFGRDRQTLLRHAAALQEAAKCRQEECTVLAVVDFWNVDRTAERAVKPVVTERCVITGLLKVVAVSQALADVHGRIQR